MIKFNLPDFIEGYLVYKNYVELRKRYPEVFWDDTVVSSVYGTFPNSVWNGGSIYVGGATYTYKYMRSKIEEYNSWGIAIRIIATNPLIEKHHLYDTYANCIMDAANTGVNEVVVNSPLLEDYLRDKYPNFKYVKSILSSYSTNTPVDLDDKYYMSCMMRAVNNNWEYLDKIPPEQRHKVEFLCTDPCPDNCPRIATHYLQMAEQQLNFLKDGSDKPNDCSMAQLKNLSVHYMRTLDCYIDRDKIIKEYVPRGYCNFKVSGRFNAGSIATGLADYLIKPEYYTDWYELIIVNLSSRGYSGWVRVSGD